MAAPLRVCSATQAEPQSGSAGCIVRQTESKGGRDLSDRPESWCLQILHNVPEWDGLMHNHGDAFSRSQVPEKFCSHRDYEALTKSVMKLSKINKQTKAPSHPQPLHLHLHLSVTFSPSVPLISTLSIPGCPTQNVKDLHSVRGRCSLDPR